MNTVRLDLATDMGKSLLTEIWKSRALFLLLTILSGFTIFGVPLSIMEMLLLGLFTSAMLTLPILQFGLYGVFIGAAFLLPHSILYYPAAFFLLPHVCHESRLIWKRRGALPEKMTTYAIAILFSISLTAAGTVLEAYLNPRLLHWCLKHFPIH